MKTRGPPIPAEPDPQKTGKSWLRQIGEWATVASLIVMLLFGILLVINVRG